MNQNHSYRQSADSSRLSMPEAPSSVKKKQQVHPDFMQFGNKLVTKRKVAFISALFINAFVTLAQQIFMLNLFYNASGYPSSTMEFIKITIQHIVVFILMAMCIWFWQQESYWNITNIKQTVCYYLMLILFTLTIPLFTYGEHVMSESRQVFLMSVTTITYICVFPPPVLHGLAGSYITIVHYLYRTHGFFQVASLEQKLMHHVAAECTICSIKGVVLVSVLVYFRIQPHHMNEGQFFDNISREENNLLRKMIKNDDMTLNDTQNKIIFGAAPDRNL